MGNCCHSSLPESKNITFGGGKYIASAVAIDSTETNKNNNSDEFSNKNFIKTKRKGGKYILSSGYFGETTLDSMIEEPDPGEALDTIQKPSSPEVKPEISDKDESKKEMLKNEEKMKIPNEDSQSAVLKTNIPQNLPNKAGKRISKSQDHSSTTLPRTKDNTEKEKPRLPRLEKQSKNQPYSLKQLRKAFHQDFQMFLLNNTLLAVQFGVEREIANRARNSTPGNPGIDKRQTEMSDRLSMTGHVYKRAICPDALHEHIFSTGQIRFLPPGAPGSSPGQGVPLRPVRVLICHEDVEVIDQEHVYSAPRLADQTPVIRIGLEQASNQPGYVKMRNLDSKLMNPARSSMTGSYVDIEDSEYSRLSDYDTNKSNPPSTSGRHCDEISSSSSLNSEAEDRFESSPQPKRAVTQVQVHRSNDAFMAKMPKIGPSTENDVSRIISDHLKEQLNSMPGKIILEENNELSSMTRSKSSPNIQYLKSDEEERKQLINIPLTDKDDLDKFTPTERKLSGILGHHTKHMRTMNRKKRPLLVPTNQQKTGSNSSNDSSGYNTGNNSFLNVPGSHRSADSTSDSEYGYTTITNINTPQTLEERRKQIKQTGVALKQGLPNTCFVPKTFRHFSEDENSEDLFQTKYYLSSKYFMDNFSNIFAELLAIDLGFAPHAINNATVCGTAITCETTALKLDIIPTVNCPYPNWPEKAIEWLLRSRLQAFDQRTQKTYSWPTRDMVQRARSKGYHLTPIGYAPRRGANPDLHLEWTIDFPEAEKYLETCLDHVQLRCYIFSLILFQAFFSISDSVTENHLRHVLFWQAENLALAWANFEMFNNIRSIYEYLYSSLSQQNLPNYFIRRRNEFQSIQRSKLHVVQRRIRNFRENPFGHILAALKHTHIGNDYPKLDYDRLIQILKAHYDVELMNPALRGITTRPEMHRVNKQDSDTESNGFWTTVKKDPKRIWNEKYHRQVEQEKKLAKEKAKTQAKQEVATDNQPHIEINVSKIHLSQNRRVLILELFVKHFIKLAHKSLELKLRSQTYEYLAHTENLFTIMREVESVDEDKLIEIRDELDALSQSVSEIVPSKSRMSTTPKGAVRKTPRKQMELPSNAEMFEEQSRTSLSLRKYDISAEENWRLQKPDSDFSEAHSTDIECNNWRGNRLMRDAPPSMIFLDVDNDESSNL